MKHLKFFQATICSSMKNQRSLLCGVRNMQDSGAQIIDPDNPLQHVASNVPPTIIGSAASTVKHHYQEIMQSIENLTRCTAREISEEKATHQRSPGEPARGVTPSVYFPADEADTDFAWKCDHALGTRWIRIHRLWKKQTCSRTGSEISSDLLEGKTSPIEEHSIEISLPCLDNRFDDNVQDPLAGNHHPFMLTVKDIERQVSLDFSMDIVNNEIILDSVVPQVNSVAAASNNQKSMKRPPGERADPQSFREDVLQFQGPCLTESPFETEESLSRPQSSEMVKMKNQVYTRLQSFLSERGLLNADESRANLLAHEKWSFWILQQIAYHEQCEYERWLANLRNFVL